ncbi:hypothetical protein HRG84_16795 [Flavisolibacter sp. BT320]|nr:hypothetical protein [Flavisolibacter longurius]
MILIIIGSILLLFGIFVYFKKNEGETEISVFTIKLKSNNSAILLICLGAVLATIGATNYVPNKEEAKVLPKTYPEEPAEPKTEPAETDSRLVSNTTAISAEKLAGTWQLTQTVVGDKALTLLYGENGEVPEGVSDAMLIAESKARYHRDGLYDYKSDMLIQFKNAASQAVDIRLKFTITGQWELRGNKITETVEDGSVVPANDWAQQLVGNNLSIADFGYRPGSSQTYSILNLTPTSLTARDPKTGEQYTWTRD